MLGSAVRLFASVTAVTVMLGAGPVLANDFTDACVAGGGGLFEAKDCACFDGKITDKGDRADMITYFKANAAVMKGGMPPAGSDAAMSKGTALVGKYLGDCAK
ncbi:MAG TPA: hypothetical protein VHW66_10535 [Stellaceae bacterium]|jgi:hypothetical protein|nr:hypothetical protein [Stellaceae bacterium]